MDNNLNLNLYRSFYYVAKYGGFTNASKYMMISQSSLSTNIKTLEFFLGVKLFDRKGAKVTLTFEGKELYKKIIAIVNILNEDMEKREITIGCLRFIADNYLDSTIKVFKNKYKNIRLSFEFLNNTELYQLLKKGELDLLICRYPVFYKFENHITVEKIKDIENIFVCSKEFYDKEKDNFNKKGYIFPLVLPNSSEKRRIIEQYLIDNNIDYKIDIDLPNSNLLKRIILNGDGIGYINKDSVNDELNNGKMIELSFFKNIPLDNVTLIYNNKQNCSIINEFIEILKSTI